MTDEHKLQRQKSRGEEAKRIIEHELVVQALAQIEATILDAWKNSRADEEQERHNAYLMYRLLQNFKAQFRKLVNDGDAASKELLRLKDPSKIARLIRNG